VGRLDKDSTGLLLLTNDGRIHHRLSHPSFDHEKEYTVTLAKPISDDSLEKMSEGIYLGKTKTRPAKIDRISGKKFKIVLQEGKNRQIRRMVEKLANRVVSLKRIRVANITLGPIKPGAWRLLKGKEKKELFKSLGISS
jgi:23S rRNA pseudouridine2605 synthase/23S rRNA pseudouridine2604 synthase